MPKIFISYRREDSSCHAGRLHDRLKSRMLEAGKGVAVAGPQRDTSQKAPFETPRLPTVLPQRKKPVNIPFVVSLLVIGLASTSIETCAQALAAYNSHLTTLKKSVSVWRVPVEKLDPSRVKVDGDTAKLIKDKRDQLMEDFRSIEWYATTPFSIRSLRDKIDLFDRVKEVHADMDDLACLTIGSAPNQRLAMHWGMDIAITANLYVHDEEQDEKHLLGSLADEIEERSKAVQLATPHR